MAKINACAVSGGTEKKYEDFICPVISKTITLDFTPTKVYAIFANNDNTYNPVGEFWDNGTYKWNSQLSQWNTRDTTPLVWPGSGAASAFNDFSVSGNTITISNPQNRMGVYILAEQ